MLSSSLSPCGRMKRWTCKAMPSPFDLTLLILIIVLITGPSSSGGDDAVKKLRKSKSSECGLYFAPSTIPNAGMGMFTGHAGFESGDVLTEGDLVIPVIELEWHNGFKDVDFLWGEYTWSPSMFHGMDQEVEDDDNMHAASPGVGAAVNCRLNLVNVEDTDDTSIGMSGVVSESPGAGAFTPYYGRKFRAKTRIPPGMELFLSYGEGYFSSRSAYAHVPLRKNYALADRLLHRFRKLQRSLPRMRRNHSALAKDLYHLIVQELPFKGRTVHALPTNFSHIDAVMSSGGTANATYNESIRDLTWLEQHGQCMDNIKDGVSTLPHAGRGAFAKRFIAEGELVAPMPLIHIPDRAVLTMFDVTPPDEYGRLNRNSSLPIHHQIMLNYCFGHHDTSLLMCPYGLLTSLINHSHKTPNAKIVWSQNIRHPEWLNQSHHSWSKTRHTGLAFDLIATRDIQEDQEIFMDYGIEWETAWQNHLAHFDRPRRGYIPAFEMNLMPDLQIQTTKEADYENFGGVYTFCRKYFVDMVLGKRNALKADKRFSIEVSDDEGEGCYPCRVMQRNHNDSYIAELFYREVNDHNSGMWEVKVDKAAYILFNVPRDAFYFNDAAYSRDHHQHWSFRHYMRIPDEIFPDSWRESNPGRISHNGISEGGMVEAHYDRDTDYDGEEEVEEENEKEVEGVDGEDTKQQNTQPSIKKRSSGKAARMTRMDEF